MDWQLFNGVLSTAAAIALTRVVLHPGIHEGLIIKTGLVTMIFSLFGAGVHMLSKSEDLDAMVRAFGSLVSGIFIVVAGIFLRTRRGKRRMRDILGVEHGPT